MKVKGQIFLPLILLTVVVIACSKNVYVAYTPSEADAQRSGVAADLLIKGQQVYVANCDRCHGFPAPERFSKRQWEKILPKMERLSKVSSVEGVLLSQYIFARVKVE